MALTYAALCRLDGERNRGRSERMKWHHR